MPKVVSVIRESRDLPLAVVAILSSVAVVLYYMRGWGDSWTGKGERTYVTRAWTICLT